MAKQALRRVIKKNVETLRKVLGKGEKMGARAFGEATGVGEGTIWRIDKEEGGTNVESLEKMAAKFKLEAWQMLLPDLDPAAPPQVLDPFAAQLMTIFMNLSEDSRDLLLVRANRLYSEEYPEERAANPFPVAVPGKATSPYKKREEQ